MQCEYFPQGNVQCANNATKIVEVSDARRNVCDTCAPITVEQHGAKIVNEPVESGGWGTVPTEAEHVAVEETPEAFKRRLTDEVQTWRDAKESLATIKADEMAAREKLTATCFPNPVKGTQRYALEGGYQVKLQYGWTYSLGDKDKLADDGTKVSIEAQVQALEAEILKLDPAAEAILRRLIRWKPEISGTEYESLASGEATELETKIKGLVDELLTVKPKSPTLDLEEPKPAK